ncbi:hypothetical protein [Photobacterium sanguinicancri]|uniref:KTSC domain-containing protein n=1 Tax=Photobacterium sanguinicancri TaxID=875932 RepID=A0ABX4G381_9GAMM|nr:hypothetical protein [Photobacterium sanguinicancri]OZS45619.1 hypothetical protein ASV53_02185 [Photobacterium sanguinicancri]
MKLNINANKAEDAFLQCDVKLTEQQPLYRINIEVEQQIVRVGSGGRYKFLYQDARRIMQNYKEFGYTMFLTEARKRQRHKL